MALKQLADERITVAATAVGFTESEYIKGNSFSNVLIVECGVETAQIRVNCLTTPTAGGSEGSRLKNPGDVFRVTGFDDIKNFRAIREGSSSGYLSCQFFGVG